MRDKNVECKQRKTYANQGENHTEVITSPSKRKELVEILLSKQVLLSERLIKRNYPYNNNKKRYFRARGPRVMKSGRMNSRGWFRGKKNQSF